MTDFSEDLKNLSEWFEKKHGLTLDKQDLDYLESKLRFVRIKAMADQIKEQLNQN